MTVTFRALTLLVFLAAALLLAVSCTNRDRDAVILYSSVDDQFLREVVAAFEKQTGLTVRIVGDTEATKTTGLVERLIAEKARPRADAWWSSEPFGTIRLAREGVLEPYTSPVEREVEGGWPREMRAADGTWYGMAVRHRVLVYSTRKLAPEALPATLGALADPRFKGRIGIARPQFGTTRGHVGALLHRAGEPAFRAWAEALHANGVRLYDGNAGVVRGVAFGEIDLGLTDSDDVYAGQREQWPVAMALIDQSLTAEPSGVRTLALPNTIARVRGGPNPAGAARLLDFLLSERTERLLAASESRNTPVRPGLAEAVGSELPPGPTPDLAAIADAIPRALQICEEVFR